MGEQKQKAKAQAHDHPTPQLFVKIGAVLFVLTGMEFAIVYLTGMQAFVYTILGVASIAKFVLVCGWFMHLKFENKFLTYAFALGATLATLITITMKFLILA